MIDGWPSNFIFPFQKRRLNNGTDHPPYTSSVISTQCTYNTLFSLDTITYAPQCATHKPERGVTQQLTQAHICIHTNPERGEAPATAHSGTYIHKPKRGTTPATVHSGTYIHTNPSVETPATAHSGTYIHTNPERGGLQQQLTQAHIYTQTLSVGASSNSSLRHIYTHKPKSGEWRLQQQLTQAHIHSRHIYRITYKQP